MTENLINYIKLSKKCFESIEPDNDILNKMDIIWYNLHDSEREWLNSYDFHTLWNLEDDNVHGNST